MSKTVKNTSSWDTAMMQSWFQDMINLESILTLTSSVKWIDVLPETNLVPRQEDLLLHTLRRCRSWPWRSDPIFLEVWIMGAVSRIPMPMWTDKTPRLRAESETRRTSEVDKVFFLRTRFFSMYMNKILSRRMCGESTDCQSVKGLGYKILDLLRHWF